jgi:hypothetical protein
MRYATCALILTLSGCVTSRPVMLPNGTQGLAISCPGAARDVADCMNKAAHVCGGPYQMLDRDGGVVAGAMVPVGSGAVYMGAVHRTLIIKCGAG